jgi:inner membrane protein
MASAVAHVFAAVSLGAALTPGRVLPRVLVVGAVCSVLPDLDVLGFAAGVPYGDVLGHRGLTHSLPFAALLATVLSFGLFRGSRWAEMRWRIGLYLFFVTASHGLFDAMTNGGLGVAFFSPFDETRYFLPFRPVVVSPLDPTRFFTARSLGLLWTELLWIGLPSLVVAGITWFSMRALSSPNAEVPHK